MNGILYLEIEIQITHKCVSVGASLLQFELKGA
jgi:hypothetical protein